MSEGFRDRLRRLRREPLDQGESSAPEAVEPAAVSGDGETASQSPASESPAAEARVLPAWVRASLQRKSERRQQRPRPAPEARSEPGQSPRDLHPASLEPLVDLTEIQGPAGVLMARETRYGVGYSHGAWQLEEALACEGAGELLSRLSGDPSLAAVDLERAVYFDTETTGLSGGAGVYVYMVGLGTFERDESGQLNMHVWQGFLREPGEERALLGEVAARIERGSSLVSFFGKSFDRHRLEDKMRIAGVRPPFDGRPHLDLYHPLQRLTQGAYEDGRLATLEAQLVGVRRASDLPGAYAPEAWFDWLAGRPHRLEGVFQHNLDDVLSLVTLAAYLTCVERGQRRDGAGLAGPPGRHARALARACRGTEQGLQWLDRALASERSKHDLTLCERRELAFERAEVLRKAGHIEPCLQALELLAQAPMDSRTPLIHESQAKLFEHRLRDPKRALQATEAAHAALQRLGGGALPTVQKSSLAAALEHRRQRLEKRCSPQAGSSTQPPEPMAPEVDPRN